MLAGVPERRTNLGRCPGQSWQKAFGKMQIFEVSVGGEKKVKTGMAVLSLSSTRISKGQGRRLHPLADFFPPLLPSAARPDTMDPHSKANESPQPQPCKASSMQRRNKKFPRMLKFQDAELGINHPTLASCLGVPEED